MNNLYQSLFFRLLLWKQLTEAFSFQLHLQVDFHFSKCQRSTRQGATFKRMNWTCIYQYFTHSTLLKPEGTCLMNYLMLWKAEATLQKIWVWIMYWRLFNMIFILLSNSICTFLRKHMKPLLKKIKSISSMVKIAKWAKIWPQAHIKEKSSA